MTTETGTHIRVVIVDDHEMVRTGLGTFLRVVGDLELIGEAGSGEDAVRVCERLQPDVVLMDMVMAGMDGDVATRCVRERCPNTHVIGLTSFPEEDLVQRALEAGATGYLLKTSAPPIWPMQFARRTPANERSLRKPPRR